MSHAQIVIEYYSCEYGLCFQVFDSSDVRTALPSDAATFSSINRDFRHLMKATEKNSNVLQCCQRKSKLG